MDVIHPACSVPVIDKLSVVVDMPDAKLHGMLINGILDYLRDKDPAFIRGWSNRYSVSVKIMCPDTEEKIHAKSPSVLLQITKVESPNRHIRLEFNPANLFVPWNSIPPTAYNDAIEDHLDMIFMGGMGVTFFQLLYHARVTRCDVYRHIAASDLGNFLFRVKYMRTSQSFVGVSGNLETLYFGSSDGNQFSIYDKAAHNKHLKKQKGHQTAAGCVRVEARLKNMNINLRDIGALPNPFDRVGVYSLENKKPPFGKPHWIAWLDSCRLNGVNNAIKKQPNVCHYKLKKAISALTVPWWKMEQDVWDYHWTNALEDAWLNRIPNSAPPLSFKALN